MPFDRVDMTVATLQPGERHLYSFEGRLGEWHTPNIFGIKWGREEPFPIEGADFPGHVTDRRLILEFPNSSSFDAILGKIAPKIAKLAIGKVGGLLAIGNEGREITHQLAKNIGCLSFDFRDMDHLGYMDSRQMLWPVMKDNPNGREPVFLTYYTTGGGWMPGPEPEAFLKIIRGLDVRTIEYRQAPPG
jgi:hypothetical protein